MKILKNIEVPTGNILIVAGEKGKLECLSISDYGKDVNLKCDSMGLSREPEKVRHTKLLPLEDKWVITISTQYGCSMGCNFCDVPKVGKGKNATLNDLVNQVKTAMSLHPYVVHSKRINLHYARMGEPTWNPNIFAATKEIGFLLESRSFGFHPVISTMMPRKNKNLKSFIEEWMRIKNGICKGNAGLQLSINSTCELERKRIFGGNACSLSEISSIMYGIKPLGRKITLNFAIADYEILPNVLLDFFDPDLYIIKLTPMHKTKSAIINGVKTKGDYTEYYPYKQTEESLKKVGYEVLVFIASKEEDESRITCGNAILADSTE